jgi:hypothetical protein
MNKIDGQVNVSGTIAYATLKQNILFGRDFNAILYDQVIEACALKPDFGTKDLFIYSVWINTFDFRYITTTG